MQKWEIYPANNSQYLSAFLVKKTYTPCVLKILWRLKTKNIVLLFELQNVLNIFFHAMAQF